jgi:serine/threonine protein kinase
VDAAAEQAAIKLLTKPRPVAYTRFRDELRIMRGNVDIPGMLPVLDAEIPEGLDLTRPWYAMPVATPVTGHLRSSSIRKKVGAMVMVAETLTALHDRGIYHRDIKPLNLLFRDNRLFRW